MKLVVPILALLTAVPAMAETLSNDTVLSMIGLGLGDEAIVAKIRTSDSEYDLSIDSMVSLKNQGVSSAVIAAMIEAQESNKASAPAMAPDSPDPMVPHPAGVYLLDETGEAARMVRIDSTISNQAKTGGILGYAITGGLASMSVKASIPNETARAGTDSQTPVFYMFFDESNPDTVVQASSWQSGSAQTINSPNEFTLIKLKQKKGRREARVGSMNIGGTKVGVMDKDQHQFDYEIVRPGVYKVVAQEVLEQGEYGFIYALNGGAAGGALTARIFDFTIY
ncbi:hypothetical protein [Sphingorhabdus sp. 109]|jgi:hypothetical protein|uniref:hypothetical protein n=1 Tax=Sphingorhabdus sp. 109 TaxID=2653173 RepID=UPI001356DA48|nr:hypothetical protein [Sphingorhabdus sp. 109]